MAIASAAARPSVSSLGYLLLLVLLLIYGLHALFIAGPATRAAAHEQLVQDIANEDRGFCEMFGARPGSDAFAACSRALATVRQKQAERDNAAAQGMF